MYWGGATWNARSNLHSRQRSKSLSSPRLISKEAGPTSPKPRPSAGHNILYKMGSEDREEKQCRGSSRGSQDENLRFSDSDPRGHNPPIPDDAYSTPFLSSEAPNSSLILCFRTNTTDGSQWVSLSFPPTASKRTASLAHCPRNNESPFSFSFWVVVVVVMVDDWFAGF